MSINGNSPGQEISLRSIDFTPPVDMKTGACQWSGTINGAGEEIT
jgi:hypothetical protein